jgi:ankyrin repeat protein
LPKGFIIRPQHRDRTEELINEMPSLNLERSFYEHFIAGFRPPTPDDTNMLELRDYTRERRGLPLLRAPNKTLCETLMSKKSALISVLPRADDQMCETGPNSFQSILNGVYISDVHRHVLCALGNNLAGLGNMSAQQLYDTLSMVSNGYIIKSFLLEKSHLRLPMAQQLLRVSIEVGDVRMVEEILSHGALQMDINELIYEVKGQRYTPLECASMLGNKDMIEVMLRHGADVHKTPACPRHSRNVYGALSCLDCDSRGALNCALLHLPKGHRPDTQIVHMLLQSTDRVDFKTLRILMRKNEDELLINILRAFAHSNQDGWKAAYKPGCVWSRFFTSIKQECMAMELLQVMERLGVAKSTRMLNAAARHGHEKVVTKMLLDKLSLDEESLCSAIQGENEQVIRRFLMEGATVNDDTGVPDKDPYSEAIRTKNQRMIQILVEHHALERLDQWNPWLAAWKAAVSVCNKDLLVMLLSKRKSIPAHHLGCALSKVAKLGDYKLAMELVERGAELEAYSDEPWYSTHPPLIEALKANKSALVNLFLESGANPNTNAGRFISPIVLAVKQRNHAMVEKLLAAGATLNSSRAKDALLEAVRYEDFQMMEKLWYAGAAIKGALEIATMANSVDACEWLLSHGADPHDSQALHNAYQHKSPSFEVLLNAYKARYPLGAGGFGSVALWSALKSSDRPTVELLLKHSADPNGFVSLGGEIDQSFTPFFFAVTVDAGNDTSLAELFLDKSKTFKCTPQTVVAKVAASREGRPGAMITALLAAVGAKNLPMVRLLSQQEEANVDFPASGRIKRTPLQRAAEVGSPDLVELFYGSGADINAPPARIGGATALQLAAQGGFTAIVVYLLNRGAHVDAPGALIDGMTALESAAANGRVDTLHVLLQANAGRGGSDHVQFQRALIFAEQAAHGSVVNMLQEYLQSIGQHSLLSKHESQHMPTE